jgi:c-di-GMP-binding flagellar brake protein YcgR
VSEADISNRVAITGQLLVRSGQEIGHILEAMRLDRDVVMSNCKTAEALFISHLLHVDPREDYIVLACADFKQANSSLLDEKAPQFHCNHRGLYYGFAARDPKETSYGGVTAIRLRLPTALVAQQRRTQARIRVPPQFPVRCEVPLGVLSFDAAVTDISLEGVGILVYDSDIRLEPGMRLRGASIVHPKKRPIPVELEVRNVGRTRLEDGRPANRAGCSISAAGGDMEDLIRLFITELE